MQKLKTGTTLQSGKYKIISVLGQGGFGITYLAEQTMLERKVAIKEFFMKDFCERSEVTSHITLGTESSRKTVNRFREKFLKEARNIAKFDHPGIVRIYDIFEENGTAYYVMDYIDGESLGDMIKRSGTIPEAEATRYIIQAAEALAYIHERKMNHLDIKPANIMINRKNESVLIDFGLSKQYDAGGQQTSTTPVGISEGYAPMEQYKKGGVGEFSPQTDIYALGATFFKLLTGKTPPSASDVYEDGMPVDELKAKGVSQKAITVICNAMKSRKKERTQSASLFVTGLKVTVPPIPKPAPANEDDEVTIINLESSNQILPEESDNPEDLYQKGRLLYKSNKYSEAVKYFDKAAEQGQKEAQYQLGNCYYYGIGINKDIYRATEWYRKASEQGHIEAQRKLSEIKITGSNNNQDKDKSKDKDNGNHKVILIFAIIIIISTFIVSIMSINSNHSEYDVMATDSVAVDTVSEYYEVDTVAVDSAAEYTY